MTKTKKRSPKSNLKFFKNRHEESGCDYDYIDKLDPVSAAFLERFTRGYYTGDRKCIEELSEGASHAPSAQQQLEEANHRRYLAGRAEALSRSIPLRDGDRDHEVNVATPESILILKKELDEESKK